jgi:linoleoyl-CoA desaturase
MTASATRPSRVHFSSRTSAAFMIDLRSAVNDWFRLTGTSSHATAAMVFKSGVMLSGFLGGYAALLWLRPGGWTSVGLILMMGVAMAGIGFNLSHDALHGAYSPRRWVNKLLGYSFDLLGASSYMWRITHNLVHHTYTNIQGVDEDLSVSPLLRLAPEARRHWWHRWQQWYAPLAYSLSTLFWVFGKDFKYFLKKDLGLYRDRKHSLGAVLELVLGKVAYYGFALIRPWWQIVAGFFAVHLIAGFILGMVFQLAHVVEGAEYPLPASDGSMAHAWAVHEMCTTSNFATGNRWLTWYIGGLNYQVEHHLFPHVCSIHYPELQELVRQVAGRHDIPYNEHATLSAAVGSHFRMLRHFGSSERQPAPADSASCCPLCGNDNNCAMARGAKGAMGCWCYGVQIPVELVIKFQDTPLEDRRCICRPCATAGRQYQ